MFGFFVVLLSVDMFLLVITKMSRFHKGNRENKKKEVVFFPLISFVKL